MVIRGLWGLVLLAVANVAATPSPEPAGYTVLGVGDVMLGSDWPEPIMDARVRPDSSAEEVMGSELARLLSSADVVFGNLEGTIHTSDIGAKTCSNPKFCYTFRSPPWHAQWLRRAGFTMMSAANNHSGDFGPTGRWATYRALTAAGIAVAGGDLDGMRFGIQTLPDGATAGLVAFGHNVGLMSLDDLAKVRAMVADIASRTDITIASCHAGAEGAAANGVPRQAETYLNENRGDVYAFAHAAIDAGADIVFCHGPHVPRAIEVYRDRFIAYSLGNFWTYGRFGLADTAGLAPIAKLRVARNGELLAAEIISARQIKPGGPTLDREGTAARRIAFLTARDMPEARVTIDAMGGVRWPAVSPPAAGMTR